MTYINRYPELTEEPTRREGATGPERPKRMRPDGAGCYVEGRHGGPTIHNTVLIQNII